MDSDRDARRLLLLWDVDHTLIENGGISKETYAAAYRELVGSEPESRPSTDGRTDLEIMRTLFAANGAEPVHDELWDPRWWPRWPPGRTRS